MWRRWIVAAGYGAHGAGMALRPDRYTSGSYAVLVDLAPMRWWGLAFVAVAALCALPVVPRTVATVALTGHTATWAAGLGAAAWVTHEGESLTGPVVWLMVLALILHSAAQPEPRPAATHGR